MIPKTINICGIPHTVRLCDDFFNADSHLGEIIYTQTEIRINKDMPEPLQTVTLVHEWLHGALAMLGFNAEASDEQFVQAMASAINQTFTIKGEEHERHDKQERPARQHQRQLVRKSTS